MLITNESLIYLNTKQAARMLGISENSLRIKVCRGEIRSYKFFGRLRFKSADLEECIKELPTTTIRKKKYDH